MDRMDGGCWIWWILLLWDKCSWSYNFASLILIFNIRCKCCRYSDSGAVLGGVANAANKLTRWLRSTGRLWVRAAPGGTCDRCWDSSSPHYQRHPAFLAQGLGADSLIQFIQSEQNYFYLEFLTICNRRASQDHFNWPGLEGNYVSWRPAAVKGHHLCFRASGKEISSCSVAVRSGQANAAQLC